MMATDNASGGSSKVVLIVDRHLKVISASVVVGKRMSSGIQKEEIGLSTDQIAAHIDLLGAESAKAQQLQVSITSSVKFTTSKEDVNDILYLLYEVTEEVEEDGGDNHRKPSTYSPLGLLRFGRRKLYCSDGTELRLLAHCPAILDFYVREQRRGLGRLLFNHMLSDGRDGARSGLTPGRLAYDRPSPAMAAFLRRHYSLDSARHQHNHYVIFDDIWRSS